MVVDLAVAIEGTALDELPEALLGQTRFDHVDLTKATPINSNTSISCGSNSDKGYNSSSNGDSNNNSSSSGSSKIEIPPPPPSTPAASGSDSTSNSPSPAVGPATEKRSFFSRMKSSSSTVRK